MIWKFLTKARPPPEHLKSTKPGKMDNEWCASNLHVPKEVTPWTCINLYKHCPTYVWDMITCSTPFCHITRLKHGREPPITSWTKMSACRMWSTSSYGSVQSKAQANDHKKHLNHVGRYVLVLPVLCETSPFHFAHFAKGVAFWSANTISRNFAVTWP